MTQRRTGRPQISVSLRFPPEVLDHLDALVALRNEREADKPESERQHIFRADIISNLLARVAPPTSPVGETERRVRDTHHHAYGGHP